MLDNITRAAADIQDTTSRQRQLQQASTPNNDSTGITDNDIRALKQKFGFLADYSDSFIRHARPDCLVKLESTNMKMKEAERIRDADDRLASNRMQATAHPRRVQAGLDDRCTILHEARFMPGMACPTARQYQLARKYLGLNGADPLGNYDMGSLGLGGQTTSKGWVDIANPSSTRIRVKSFSINNCGQKSSGSLGKDSKEDREFLEVAEFTVALRTIRTAMHLVHPWNLSLVALENYLLAENMCKNDIGGLDKQAAILTRFTDYVMSENAARWRDEASFLDYNALQNAWTAFYSALPQSQLHKIKQEYKPNSSGGNNYSSNSGSNSRHSGQRGPAPSQPRSKQAWNLPYIEVCYKWNRGFCNKAAGTCTTSNGRQLKHCCDERTDPSDLSKYCGQAHKRVDGHP